MGDTSKWNKVKEQILNIGNEICGNKKLEHKQQWMTEEILEKMEQMKEQKDKDIARYKLLDRERRQECKQAKEEHYNHLSRRRPVGGLRLWGATDDCPLPLLPSSRRGLHG